MIKLYDHELSGNCHKVRLMLSLLDLEHEVLPVDLMNGQQNTPEFLELNPFGLVPVIVDGDFVISDSQAVLVYLARNYGNDQWLPLAAEPLAKVTRWLAVAANEIQHSLSSARLHCLLGVETDLAAAQSMGHRLLQIMDRHLAQRNWLELNTPTIADVACYPYIALAHEGNISLEPYFNILAWLQRIKSLPGYIGMPGL